MNEVEYEVLEDDHFCFVLKGRWGGYTASVDLDRDIMMMGSHEQISEHVAKMKHYLCKKMNWSQENEKVA